MRRVFLVLLLLSLAGCSERPKTHLEHIQARGELLVVTRNSPTTYYIAAHGEAGLEFELASRFANHLGVELRLIVAERFGEILPMVVRGEADLAAAGLTATESRRAFVRFGPTYQEITQQVVYRRGSWRPRGIEELNRGELEVVAGSSHAERLEDLLTRYPDLHWRNNGELDSEELLHLVAQQLIDYTVADSNDIAMNQRFHPELRVAFDLTEPQPLAWALPPGDDDSLLRASQEFFTKLRKDGTLEQLLERYYGHVARFDYVGTRLYLRHIQQRLPKFRQIFEQAAAENELDWRLLAAMGYQESHWNPRARSPTGVRGIMMLTQVTAAQLDIDNRLDPDQSIAGGTRYFRIVKDKIPERIPEPDRTWMALAAYNVGFGHLEDARRLTERRGGDPDKWVEVKKTLPLLSQRKWYKQTRYGYARGREPVRYVDNVRSYYDLLVWHLEREQSYSATPKAPAAPKVLSPVL